MFYILGPCAAESREQVLETAEQICSQLSAISIPQSAFIFRAGVWKPRTSPHTFQGAGEAALAWLQEVKERFGMPVATEAATPEHVEAAMKAGVDYLWIGARTSANPIAVEAIASQIKNSKSKNNKYPLRGVLIKNPVNADAALWLGNIERLERTGVPVTAVHRGCNHQPCWAMAHAVRQARPDIPMLLDPSHMSGDAKQVPALIEKGAELGLDGAMVEVHYQPSEALSDAGQQISPEGLTAALKDHFVERPLTLKDRSAERLELNWLRAEIDELDDRLWDTIAQRMDVSRRIGVWKKAHGVAPLQPNRYQQIVEKLKIKNDALKMNGTALGEEFMARMWELIHEESLKRQE